MSESSEVSSARRWKRRRYVIFISQLVLLLCADDTRAKPMQDSGILNKLDLQCPRECNCLGNVVNCNGLQLIDAPSDLPPWIEDLELKKNNFSRLESNALVHLTKLRVLDVSENRLSDDVSEALNSLTQLRALKINKNQLRTLPNLYSLKNLTHLSMTHNLVQSIDGQILVNLPRLQFLDLSSNHIPVLQRESFLAPNSLTYLNLNSNKIRVIENGSLDNLTSLKELRLNKNRLTHLKDLFTNLAELRILELNRNELEQIQGLSFKNLTSLEQLKLKRNRIRSLDTGAIVSLNNLSVLQLDHNLLTVVMNGGLFGLSKLHMLTISHNKIEAIKSQAWECCQNITELDLSHNELVSIDQGTFQYLGKLEQLKLDHNKITFIADGAFNNTPNLRILELNENKISYMVEDINGAFAPLINLEKLGLASNRIKSINKNSFVGLMRLTELDLNGNNITSIAENALISMPNLSRLRMKSDTLLCDCGLQWLSIWLRSHKYSEARVRCGYPSALKGTLLTELHRTNFTCDEHPKPLIIGEPKTQMSIKGDNVTLYCRATSTANTPLRFTWKHDNAELKNFDIKVDTESLERGITEALSSLYLTNLTHADAGRYQCMVSNDYGTTYSAKAKISVLVYPSFTKNPQDMQVPAGRTAKLVCAAKGQPTPQIAWQKDGGNDFPAARERRMYMMPSDDELFIVDFKVADTGVYSCTAQNLAGTIVANASLTISETPSFVKPMENKEIIVGESIVLECMASGYPRPKLLWRKNGSPLQTTERHFFTAEDQLLIIVDTIPSDAGSYECQMNNSFGTAVGTSHLTINPVSGSMVNEDDMLGIIIITVVCCAVGTSVVWVVIIYQTRRRLSINQSAPQQFQVVTSAPVLTEAQTHLYLDTSSQHSKDSGTGDSTNPSSDQLQLCLPEEIVTTSTNNEEVENICGSDPLLGYTNHERLEEGQSESVADDASSVNIKPYGWNCE
ncbi:leucine-rich repeats and immunoglobulin-like domains protein 3 isoform X1 [Diprion similis]|uniref:leucine-rich repeats and immunoglobulin-like domains protein 3 isoform X1 n=1 Tax=Diprion similis TaxID=362088 RepID=UPI001EF8CE4B|nr:leucine-rich repeats and immunoglobulin-like domains protein 3 isoform X1 [Diprion similis]